MFLSPGAVLESPDPPQNRPKSQKRLWEALGDLWEAPGELWEGQGGAWEALGELWESFVDFAKKI